MLKLPLLRRSEGISLKIHFSVLDLSRMRCAKKVLVGPACGLRKRLAKSLPAMQFLGPESLEQGLPYRKWCLYEGSRR